MTCIIGGGFSGLILSCLLVDSGQKVTLLDHATKVGQKWMVAASSGMNLSVDLSPQILARNYLGAHDFFTESLMHSGPAEFGSWLNGFGFFLKSGNGRRLFAEGGSPKDLLDRVLAFLNGSGLFSLFTNCEVLSFHSQDKKWIIKTDLASDKSEISADKLVLACGGVSYPGTGSDGKWLSLLSPYNFKIEPFLASNCAFKVEWSEKMNFNDGYRYLKNVSVNGTRGDLTLTPFGVEGSPVYTNSAYFRNSIIQSERAIAEIDLLPDLTLETIKTKLKEKPQGKMTLSNWLRKTLNLNAEAFNLLMEISISGLLTDTNYLAQLIKNANLVLIAIAPIDRAISTAGGLCFEQLNKNLESLAYPNLFFCGEMLNFDAPTGGFLMQACFTTASVVAKAIID